MILKPDQMFAQMFWNQACSFSGDSSSYISVRPTPTTDITGSFTIEAWLKKGYFNGLSRGIVSKGYLYGAYSNFGLRITPEGRIEIVTNGQIRLVSRSSSALPLSKWTHIAAKFNLSSNGFSIYKNGILDTSVTSTVNVTPTSTTDSLFIGLAGKNRCFEGTIDELRIWNTSLSEDEIRRNMRLSLGTGSGNFYNNLILSMTFQKEVSGGEKFTCIDWSNHNNYGKYYDIIPVDLSGETSQTISINESVYLTSNDQYLAGADDPDISPTNAITLQAWIYPLTNLDGVILHKGPPNGGTTTNYNISRINRRFSATINGHTYDSQDTIPVNQWSHVAFVYSYNTSIFLGSYSFFVNGKPVKAGQAFGVGNVVDGSDSLYIGGSLSLPVFWGYLDEVRISNHAKSESDINDSLYTSMENGINTPGVTITYNFDGYTYCNSLRGPILRFRNGARFTNTFEDYHPVSPLNKDSSLTSFQKGFYMKTAGLKIPVSGTIGSIEDSLEILLDENITDVNFFVAMDHGYTGELNLSVRPPGGSYISILSYNTLLQNADNVITVFDDQSGNDLINDKYITYSPTVKSRGYLNTFNGSSSKGIWKIYISDDGAAGTGRLYSWGVQINNKTVLPKKINCTAIIQGFYNASGNNMIRDTIKSYLRNSSSPFTIIDSSKVYLKSDGSGVFTFNNSEILKARKYYLQIKHRNSIETWSNTTGVIFEPLTSQSTYNFTSDSTKAFGNNLIHVDNTPVKFAIYSGDVNQDGFVDVSDASLIDNDLFNFTSGYILTDLTGDNTADLSDASIADNNIYNFVNMIRP